MFFVSAEINCVNWFSYCGLDNGKGNMSDPKQPIYDAMNWLACSIPLSIPDDKDLVIAAYEKVYAIEDKEAQELFRKVLLRLSSRNAATEKTVNAWRASVDRLRQACLMIDELRTSAAQSAEGE